MVKLSLTNLSSKAGKRIDVANVEKLDLKNKQISELAISFEPFKALRELDLSANRLQFERQLTHLWSAPALEVLFLKGNPICSQDKQYRSKVVAHLALLRELDGVSVSLDERAAAYLEFPALKPAATDQSDAVADALKRVALKQEADEAAARLAGEQAIQKEQEAAAKKREQIKQDKIRVMREAEEQRRVQEAKELEKKRLIAEARRREQAGSAGNAALGDVQTEHSVTSEQSGDGSVPAPVPAKVIDSSTAPAVVVDSTTENENRDTLASIELNAQRAKEDALKEKEARDVLFGGGGGGGNAVKPSLFGRGRDIFADDDDDDDDDDDEVDAIFGRSTSSNAPAAAKKTDVVADILGQKTAFLKKEEAQEASAKAQKEREEADKAADLRAKQRHAQEQRAAQEQKASAAFAVDESLFGLLDSKPAADSTNDDIFSFASTVDAMLSAGNQPKPKKGLFED